MTEFLAGGDISRALENAEQEERKRARNGLAAFGFKSSPAPVFFKLKKKDQRLVTVMLESYDIISHLRTFNSVKDTGRRVLKRVLNAPFASEEGCRAMIAHWLAEYFDSLKTELADVDYIALTTDGWTNYATDHFATITLHFMSRGFGLLQSRCIGCVHERDNVISAEVIARDLDARLTRIGWNVNKTIVAITTDEGSNFRALVTRALRNETGRAIIDPGVICVDHMLKTALEQTLRVADGVRDLFDRCNKLSSICRSTRSIKLMLHEAQRELHAQDNDRPFPCSAVLPVLTRWGSHYDCVARLLSLRDALNQVYGQLAATHGPDSVRTVHGAKYKPFCDALLVNFEWANLKHLETILRPFRSLITLAQGEYYATMATTWASLITNLSSLDPADDDGPSISTFKAEFKARCESKFCVNASGEVVMSRTAALSLALDPRYKALDILHRYPILREFQQRCLLEEVTAGLNVAAPHPDLIVPVPGPQREVLPQPDIDPAFLSARSLQRHGTGAMQAMIASVPMLPLLQERRVSPEELITAYRATENMACNATQEEVLNWFRLRKSDGRFAILLAVAEKCIFVPVSSAPSERVASTAGGTYTKRRVRLQADIAEAIIVAHEAKRRIARRIVQMAPDLLRELLEHALIREGAIDGEAMDDAVSESSDAAAAEEEQRVDPIESDSDEY
jgi:hypothetical protein